MAVGHMDIKICGPHVQGVGLRWCLKKYADEVGVSGFVGNKPDGTVFAEAEGDMRALNKFLARCKEGTPFSEIERVECDEGAVKGYVKFELW